MRAYYSDSGRRADAYALLALAVERVCGIPCPEVAKDPRGKPYFPLRRDIHFSISHTGRFVMAAVSAAPCGCDVEVRRPLRASVEKRVCGEAELAALPFFDLWVLKESYIKLVGFLPCELNKLCFSLEGGCIIAPDPRVQSRLYTLPGASAGICALEPPPEELIFIPHEEL